MSLLWRDRHVAVLGSDSAILIRQRRGWRGAFDLKLDAPYEGPPAEAAPAALQRLLDSPEVGRGSLTLVLSNQFVRYVLVPWNDDIASPGEFVAYAQICCDQVYGSDTASTGRVLRVSREKAGSPRLAAIIDTAFLGALERVVANTSLKLVSVQPYLAAVFNRLNAPALGKHFFFLVAEPERCCLLVALNDRWRHVHAAATADSPDALANLIDRETQLLGLEDSAMPPIFVHAPRHARLDLPACRGIQPMPLGIPIPASLTHQADHLLAMAMAAS